MMLKIEDYYEPTGKQEVSLLELMDAIPGGEGIDFEPQKVLVKLRPADLS